MLRVNFALWLWRIVAWDTVLPIFVVLLPFAIEQLFPNFRGALELAALIAPIVAFFLRLKSGRRQIALSTTPYWFRPFQFAALFLGALILVLFDAVMILTHIMPPGAVGMEPQDALIPLAIYLSLMAIAMFPGRTEPAIRELELGSDA